MKKTYVTSMPNHIGAFLKASECFSNLGINITRVSYNKAVDSHILFIDAEGTEEKLIQADRELEKIGYLKNDKADTSIVLIEFRLSDVPVSVTEVLRLINEFRFNISYISSQENGTDYQYFKMGLYVEEPEKVSEFIVEAEKLCHVRIIDYNATEKVFDNSIFYNTYVPGLARTMGLSEEVKQKLCELLGSEWKVVVKRVYSDLTIMLTMLKLYKENRVAIVDEEDGELKPYTIRAYVYKRMAES